MAVTVKCGQTPAWSLWTSVASTALLVLSRPDESTLVHFRAWGHLRNSAFLGKVSGGLSDRLPPHSLFSSSCSYLPRTWPAQTSPCSSSLCHQGIYLIPLESMLRSNYNKAPGHLPHFLNKTTSHRELFHRDHWESSLEYLLNQHPTQGFCP